MDRAILLLICAGVPMTIGMSREQCVQVFDTRMMGLEGFTGVCLIPGVEPVLVDAGTLAGSDALVDWLRSLNVIPACVVVTHAHHDHIGGLDAVMRAFEGVRVLASPLGAERLLDPRTVNRHYTAEELVPVSGVQAVREGEEMDLAGLRLRFHLTPGHSADSLSLHELSTDTLFVGDLPGDWLWGTTFLPPCATEDFDEVAYRQSMDRMMGLGARNLVLSHFGVFSGQDAAALLPDLRLRHERWKDVLLGAYATAKDASDVAVQIRELLSGSALETVPGWNEATEAFAAWCLMGYRHAGLLEG